MQSYSAKAIKVSSHFRVGVLSKVVGGLRKAVLCCTHKPSKCLQSACLPPKQLKTPAPSSCSLSFCRGGKKKQKREKYVSGHFQYQKSFFFSRRVLHIHSFPLRLSVLAGSVLTFPFTVTAQSITDRDNWKTGIKKKRNPTSVKTLPGSPQNPASQLRSTEVYTKAGDLYSVTLKHLSECILQ